MNFEDIKKLTDLVKTSGVTAIEVDENGSRIRIENGLAPTADQPPVNVVSVAAEAAPATEPAKENDQDSYYYISSPLVGIFCSLEKMGKSALSEGDPIDSDSVVCGVEAMKLICDVKSDVSGTFVEYLVKDGDQVEFGQSLVKIKR